MGKDKVEEENVEEQRKEEEGEEENALANKCVSRTFPYYLYICSHMHIST